MGRRAGGPAAPPVDAETSATADGLAAGVCAAARVLAGMGEADRDGALRRGPRADDAVRWMVGVRLRRGTAAALRQALKTIDRAVQDYIDHARIAA